jgi:HTH-type transcriptional regulator/antitoxin MqsA
MMATETPRHCRECNIGILQPATWQQHFAPLGKPISVELLTSVCDHCGDESISTAQQEENLRRLKARKVHYGALLMGEELVAFRLKYGLTQKMAAQIFGKGKIAFSRYENEVSYPDASTTKLLNLAIRSPEALKLLAEDAGIEIPLWEARMEDERKAKATRLRLQQTAPQLVWSSCGKPAASWPPEPAAACDRPLPSVPMPSKSLPEAA